VFKCCSVKGGLEGEVGRVISSLSAKLASIGANLLHYFRLKFRRGEGGKKWQSNNSIVLATRIRSPQPQ
jgi:hypothetical protein